MNLAVLGERVFVRPVDRPEFTASGLTMVHDRVASTVKGVVIAVGDGPEARKTAVTRALAPIINRMTQLLSSDAWGPDATAIAASIRAHARLIDEQYQPEHLVEVGDTVLFSADAGEELIFEKEVIIAMRETDILAVVEEDA